LGRYGETLFFIGRLVPNPPPTSWRLMSILRLWAPFFSHFVRRPLSFAVLVSGSPSLLGPRSGLRPFFPGGFGCRGPPRFPTSQFPYRSGMGFCVSFPWTRANYHNDSSEAGRNPVTSFSCSVKTLGPGAPFCWHQFPRDLLVLTPNFRRWRSSVLFSCRGDEGFFPSRSVTNFFFSVLVCGTIWLLHPPPLE